MKLFTCCWSRQKDVSPALPSVSNEVLRDILLPLDRRTLDDVQFACRRFRRLITELMSNLCLRQIESADFAVSNKYCIWRRHNYPRGGFYIFARPAQRIRKRHVDIARLFSKFAQALRSSRVKRLFFNGLVFTPELAALVLRTPIFADYLGLWEGSCTKLTPTQFHKLVMRFSPTHLLFESCNLRACQVTDDFILALSRNRVLRTSFPYMAPVDGGTFCVTDDAVVELCMQRGVQSDQLEHLTLYNGSFTKRLFERLVEACSVSKRTQPLRISVSPSPLEYEDLRDFAGHLSYRCRGTPWQTRIYDFPGQQRGACTKVCLQIVLHPDNKLEILRAPCGHHFFYESDEE